MHRYFTIQGWSLGKYLHISAVTPWSLFTESNGEVTCLCLQCFHGKQAIPVKTLQFMHQRSGFATVKTTSIIMHEQLTRLQSATSIDVQ